MRSSNQIIFLWSKWDFFSFNQRNIILLDGFIGSETLKKSVTGHADWAEQLKIGLKINYIKLNSYVLNMYHRAVEGERILPMDGEYALRYGCRNFAENKVVLKAKLDKTLCAHLFNSTVLSVILYASETLATQRRKNSDWLWHRELWKDPCWKYCCMSTSEAR